MSYNHYLLLGISLTGLMLGLLVTFYGAGVGYY